MTATTETVAAPASADVAPTVVTIPCEDLVPAVQAVVLAAGKDDTLPTLQGVRIEWDSESVTLAATDRYRLHVATISAPDPSRVPGAALVPAKEFLAAVKPMNARTRVPSLRPAVALALPGADVPVWESTVTLATAMVGPDGAPVFYAERTDVMVRQLRTIPGEFPRYRSLIPDMDSFAPGERVSTVAANPAFLADACKAAGLVSDRGRPLVLDIGKESRPFTVRTAPGESRVSLLALVMPVRLSA